MKKVLTWFAAVVVVAMIGGAFAYLYKKSQSSPVVFETELPEVLDITEKTVATGSIVPRREVEVKPKVTGVVAQLYVEPGKKVKQGDPLAKVSIVPDAMQINQAESGLRTAQIAFDNAKRELQRNEELFKRGVIADAELQRFRTEFALRQQEMTSAGQALQLVKEGATRGQGKESTLIVTSTADGTVIDVPVKLGFSVIQANNFNPGTTVAIVADMDDIIFEGRVDEAEVAKITEGMKLTIKVGALEKEALEATLEYISPKGKTVDGAIQFEIRAAVKPKPGTRIRANYSANADIVIAEKKQVLAIREALVQYDDGKDENTKGKKASKASTTTISKDDKPYVEVETAPQTFVRRDVKLGISDGISVEVLSGVQKTDKIKIPETAGPAEPEEPEVRRGRPSRAAK